MNRLTLPVELAAVIDQRKPCETCGGDGFIENPNYCCPDDEPPSIDCPDCGPLIPFVPSPKLLRVGDEVEIAAGPSPGHCVNVGRFQVTHKGDGAIVMYDTIADGRGYHGAFRLRPGEVVATAVVADVLPVVDEDHMSLPAPFICVYLSGRVYLWGTKWGGERDGDIDLSYLSGYGVIFTPGGFAVALDQIERTTP